MTVSRRYFFLGGLSLTAYAAKTPPERPNVVLVLTDGLPAWALGAYGNKEVRTPNIDRLSQTGAVMAKNCVCTPAAGLSRATLATGRTPMQLGDAQKPPAGGTTLDSLFAGLGYAVHAAEIGAAGEFLDRQAAGKPFFLTVGYPHLEPPYGGVAQKYLDLYAQAKFETLNLERGPAANAQRGKEMLGDIVAGMRKAAAAVTALDAEVGTVVSRLSQKGLRDHTLVIFTSSCGSLWGRHGLWGSGDASEPVNMYEEAVITPLIWSWIGHVPAQAVRPELVSTYDLVPTLCDLLGVPAPAGHLCGRSYLPLVTGKPLPKKEPWRTTVFGHYRNTDMARSDRYKLVSRDGGKGPGELYDLVADPGEKTNQNANPQFLTVRTSLWQALSAWKQRFSQ
jgi:arylsulfatase A-like enzyme